MSETLVIIVLAISVFAIVLVVAVVMIVLARLRRVIQQRFEMLQDALGTLQPGPTDDKPGEPHSK